ncbi:seipin-2-like [Hordeum vulgare subsp. vulgare]|uniref:Seipin n=1 Tax=Hordeum vulgare subsp. vulgare TaxID=112509 RepID=A0A8I6XR26_HORVV|nr:seipin-2-like [Hordeum vulgare subsp. vulgare]
MDADDPAAAPSAPPASVAAFFDAPDALPTPPPPPSPHTPSSSTLRRRPRRAQILKQPDDPVSPSASASSTVTAADEPDKDKAKHDSDSDSDFDSSEATSAPRSPTPLEEEVDQKDAEPAAPEANVEEKDAEPATPEANVDEKDAEPATPESDVSEKDAEPASSEEEVDEKVAEPEASATDHRPTAPPPVFLESLAMLVIKAVAFQVSALVACLVFPFRLMQWWYLFVTDPLGSAQRARDWALGVAGQATGAVNAWLGAGEGVARVVARLLWGSLWAMYVCMVLCALLAMAFTAGGLLVGKVVEEPVQVTENLNFDYTKPRPVAFVPVGRLVPPHQRMQLEVLLTLPESDYNRRLGVFQVRAELLSADGKVVTASSQPCMLKFKSVHMHFIETFLQSVSLLSGYSSESQVIRLKMTGIKQAFEPITGVRILLEQRAEFATGAGIPEIYAASLKLEAELPLLKKVLWHWRWTMFVWSSMAFFAFELLLAVVCCRPCIFPRS